MPDHIYIIAPIIFLSLEYVFLFMKQPYLNANHVWKVIGEGDKQEHSRSSVNYVLRGRQFSHDNASQCAYGLPYKPIQSCGSSFRVCLGWVRQKILLCWLWRSMKIAKLWYLPSKTFRTHEIPCTSPFQVK